MSSNVEKHLNAKLAATAGVASLVSSRIYPVHAPQDAVFPYIIYSRSSTRFINSQDGYTGTGVAMIVISSWAKSYSGAKALADVVRSAIDGWRDQTLSPKIDLASLVDESDIVLSPEDGSELPYAYGVSHDVDISFEES